MECCLPSLQLTTSHYAEVKDDGTGRIQSVMSEGMEQGVEQKVMSAKDKKKLEKEEKAREKKLKKQLKNEERKIKEEAKKKQETPAEMRHRRRREAEKTGSHGNRTVLGLLSLNQPAIRPKNMKTCRVHLLDGTDYDFEIEV